MGIAALEFFFWANDIMHQVTVGATAYAGFCDSSAYLYSVFCRSSLEFRDPYELLYEKPITIYLMSRLTLRAGVVGAADTGCCGHTTIDENNEGTSNQVDSSSGTPFTSHVPPDSLITTLRACDLSTGQPSSRKPAQDAGQAEIQARGSSLRRAFFRDRKISSEDPLGLTLVHGPSDRDADLIFVHGLGGSSRKTWSWNRDPANFWPEWIHQEDGLSKIRVFTFGYNANFRESKTPLTILDFSKSLLLHTRSYKQGSNDSSVLGLKPIVFICHSMGGLVVKKALVVGQSQDEYCSMLSKVQGIMFLSTPHRGSSHAATLNSLLSLAGLSRKIYVSELDPKSTSIEDINEQFRGICGSWKLVSLYETKMTRLSPGIRRMVVDKNSGRLQYPKELTVPLEADHHTICKFQSPLDPSYQLVVNLLKQLVFETESHLSKPPIGISSTATGILGDQGPEVSKELDDYHAMLRMILGINDDTETDISGLLSSVLPDSCQWLYRSSKFRTWLDSTDPESSVLWLTGLPGTGKSTLAANTIDHLQHTEGKQNCQYHFFKESQPRKRCVAYCLQEIAFQLAKSHKQFADQLVELHHNTGFTAADEKLEWIWGEIFENMVFKINFGHTLHWVFDGLDEAREPKSLIRKLLEIESRTCIKLLFLSRPDRELTSLAKARLGTGRLWQITTGDTRDDIEAYIALMTSEIFPEDNGSVQNRVIQEIQSRAEGSFLWTNLVLNRLRHSWHRQGDIETVLSDIPEGMEPIYQGMMTNVINQGPRLKEIGLLILTWATYGFRPLNIAELTAALQPKYGGFVNVPETAVQICGQFIRVDGDTVSLIHTTAREFLINNLPLGETGELSVWDRQQAGHDTLAIVCLQYLSQDHWRRTLSILPEEQQNGEEFCGGSLSPVPSPYSMDRLEPLYERFPLLNYATNHWPYHVSHASLDNLDLLPCLRQFCNKDMLQWIHAVALSNNLNTLPAASRQLKSWVRRRARRKVNINPIPEGSAFEISETGLVAEWAVDLVHIMGKFGSNLAKSPSSIYKNIPPLCPGGSIMFRTYGGVTGPKIDQASAHMQLLSVTGLGAVGWDDNLARLTVGADDEIASAIRCAGNYVLALVSFNGVVVVWQKETCEEVHRLFHGEWVTLLSTDKAGLRAATAGRFTFRVWELTTGSQIFSVPKISPSRALSLDFASERDLRLIIGYDDCSLVSYDPETTQEETIFTKPQQLEGIQRRCPRLMSLSPDQRKLAIAFPGQPLEVWDMAAVRSRQQQTHIPSSTQPRICIRNSDRDLSQDGQDTCNYPEVVRWHPVDGMIIYILYQDTIIVVWDLVEDSQVEHRDTEAKEMVLNNNGSLLLTSNNQGSIRVWALPSFHLIYELKSDEFVRDLSFSPDSQRIYDVRGSTCNVWAPEILVHLVPRGVDEKSGKFGDIPEPVLAEDQRAQRSQITTLVADDHGEFFCVGHDGGAISIHSMSDGKVVRNAYKHSGMVEITLIEWSISRRFIASADDSGKIVAKRLRIKEDGKWAVFPMFDLRVSDTIKQLLFSEDETLLLVSTESTDRVWDLGTKTESCKRRWASKSRAGGRWLHHPHDPAQLVWLSPGQVRAYTWVGFLTEPEDIRILPEEEEERPVQSNLQIDCSEEGEEDEDEDEDEDEQDLSLHTATNDTSYGSLLSPPRGSLISSPHSSSPDLKASQIFAQDKRRPSEIVKRVLHSSNRNYILYESLPIPSRGNTNVIPMSLDVGNKLPYSSSSRLLGARNRTLLQIIHLSHDGRGPICRRPLRSLSCEIRYLLGCVRDKVVFIDHENWVCTASAILTHLSAALPTKSQYGADIGSSSASSIKRHFFLPRDWVNPMTLQLVTKKGTLLSARNGEVAVLRYAKGF